MALNPYESPSESAVPTKQPINIRNWLIVILIIWFSLPLAVIGGIILLARMGGRFGD